MTTPMSGLSASDPAAPGAGAGASPRGTSRGAQKGAQKGAPRSGRPNPASLTERQTLVRRLVRPALILISVVLVADALIGDKGLLEHRRQAQRREVISQELDQRRRENQELRVRARRLREGNPTTIEDLARRKLGMIKAGELLFVVRDAETPAASAPTASAPAATPPAAR